MRGTVFPPEGYTSNIKIFYIILKSMSSCMTRFVSLIATDHDECINNTHKCDHTCHNIQGGYVCSCYDGYRLEGNYSCKGRKERYTCVHKCFL